LDRNHSDDPTQLSIVAGPALEDKADLVMGSRIKGRLEKGATFFDLHTEQLTYGWLAEMVVKTVKTWWRIRSVPVPYRKRLGKSKVSGTVRGSLMAAYFLFFVPLHYLWRE
jgi:hypothetical protein